MRVVFAIVLVCLIALIALVVNAFSIGPADYYYKAIQLVPGQGWKLGTAGAIYTDTSLQLTVSGEAFDYERIGSFLPQTSSKRSQIEMNILITNNTEQPVTVDASKIEIFRTDKHSEPCDYSIVSANLGLQDPSFPSKGARLAKQQITQMKPVTLKHYEWIQAYLSLKNPSQAGGCILRMQNIAHFSSPVPDVMLKVIQSTTHLEGLGGL